MYKYVQSTPISRKNAGRRPRIAAGYYAGTDGTYPRLYRKILMDGDAGGLETAIRNDDRKKEPTEELVLNLSREEYLSAVVDQPKPLFIPLCTRLPLPGISPLDVYTGTKAGNGYLLESMEGSEKIARYSFIGIDPELFITFNGNAEISGNPQFVAIAGEPEGANAVDRIRSVLSRFSYVNVKAPRFFGGMVGYFAYDCVYSLFAKVNEGTGSDLTPRGGPGHEACFMLSTDCIVFDHREKCLYIFSSPLITYESDLSERYERTKEKIAAIKEKIAALAGSHGAPAGTPGRATGGKTQYVPSVSKEAFERAVEHVKEHISAGDIFQAVISRRIECEVACDPFAIYTALREINPSPYMYYLDFGDEKVIGASPEMLVRVERRRVTTVPIAGTRPRGRTPEEDMALSEDLLNDAKERAEHTMLVDLARNDIGRVCRFGSVNVEGFMGIEKFSHVQHIVSTVNGVLKDNLDCYDALKSCFPAGTVSGAPKIRAMQIINEEEGQGRGIYAGAVGWIGFDKNLEFAIAIRTVILQKNRASIQVGAGIVADSVPANEWKETENKAAAMMRAIERAGAVE
jgi:anthranilate synthase component 1